MHEYSIHLKLYALSIQIETAVDIVWNDGTTVLVSADYTHRTEQSFSILKLVGRRVLSCRFDDTVSLVLDLAGGESVRCIAEEPVESYTVCGITDGPLHCHKATRQNDAMGVVVPHLKYSTAPRITTFTWTPVICFPIVRVAVPARSHQRPSAHRPS